MAKIEWAQVCELAFVDKYDRLCMIGVTTKLAVPSLPLLVRRLMIAARIADAQDGETFTVGGHITTPGGNVITPNQTDCFDVSIEGEYLLITLSDFPLSEEGIYGFEVSVGDQAPVRLEILARLIPRRAGMEIPKCDSSVTSFEPVARPTGRDVN